jgi:hypothetical protein
MKILRKFLENKENPFLIDIMEHEFRFWGILNGVSEFW